jgi:hypothetical protein
MISVVRINAAANSNTPEIPGSWTIRAPKPPVRYPANAHLTIYIKTFPFYLYYTPSILKGNEIPKITYMGVSKIQPREFLSWGSIYGGGGHGIAGRNGRFRKNNREKR